MCIKVFGHSSGFCRVSTCARNLKLVKILLASRVYLFEMFGNMFFFDKTIIVRFSFMIVFKTKGYTMKGYKRIQFWVSASYFWVVKWGIRCPAPLLFWGQPPFA